MMLSLGFKVWVFEMSNYSSTLVMDKMKGGKARFYEILRFKKLTMFEALTFIS